MWKPFSLEACILNKNQTATQVFSYKRKIGKVKGSYFKKLSKIHQKKLVLVSFLINCRPSVWSTTLLEKGFWGWYFTVSCLIIKNVFLQSTSEELCEILCNFPGNPFSGTSANVKKKYQTPNRPKSSSWHLKVFEKKTSFLRVIKVEQH